MAREQDPAVHDHAPQAIPLRTLGRHSDDERDHVEGYYTPGHGRTSSLFNRGRTSTQYARIGDQSPTRQARAPMLQTMPGAGVQEALGEPYSPVSPSSFAAAHIGLSFRDPEVPMTTFDAERRPVIITTPAEGDNAEAGNSLSPQDDDDLTPLTARRGSQRNARLSTGMSERMSRKSSVRWQDGNSPTGQRGRSARLGDDLLSVSPGLSINGPSSSAGSAGRLSSESVIRTERSRSRSLSPSPSPLFERANSIFREISQRVVNISNDSEMVEQSLRRRSSANRPRHGSTISRAEDPEEARASFSSQGRANDASSEKPPSVVIDPEPAFPIRRPNPLRGKSLGIFGPENGLRKWLLEVLTHPVTEPIILVLIVLQTVLLAVNAAADAQYLQERSRQWGRSGFDYAILGLFVIYSLEVIARVIVSGFLKNPVEYSVLDRSQGFRKGVVTKMQRLFSLQHDEPPISRRGSIDFEPSIVRAFTGMPDLGGPGHGRQKQRVRLARRAFLRHSFNRLDFLAVVAFWISFTMQLYRVETTRHIYVFDMLSCLRILRLLGLTAGTSIILRSLKKAAPLLVNVAFLISFFWLVFAIIGVQSFKSSLRRTCVWVGDDGSGSNYTQNLAPENIQFCGGYLDAVTGQAMPWVRSDGSNGTDKHKGFLCPQNSLCVEGDTNPYNSTVSFDNIIASLELVFVVISSNTWSDIMYYLTNSDYLVVALFFAAGIVVLSLWLVNLLVAVITSSFQIIREESKQSAFTTKEVEHPPAEDDHKKRVNKFKQFLDKITPFWIVLITVDLIIAALRSASMSSTRESLIANTETVVTLLLLVEIILRFASDWRGFFKSKRNCFDLLVAIVTSVMQIPPIRSSGQLYAWLSMFQIFRIYRVVMAVRVTRELVMVVLGNVVGLINLIIFVFLFTFLAAIMASQLFRGDIPYQDDAGNTNLIQFFDIWNSFIGMYIIFSSENWTSIVYSITSFNLHWDTAWIGALFCITWFTVANLIVLNMFIAVIQESFDVSEDEKRLQQVKAFLKQKELSGSSAGNLSLSTMFRLGRDQIRHRDNLEYGGAAMEQLLKDAVVKDFLDEQEAEGLNRPPSTMLSHLPGTNVSQLAPSFMSRMWTRISGFTKSKEPNPFYSDRTVTRANEEFDARAVAKQVVSVTDNRKRAQRQYLQRHPKYNVSLFMFKPSNPIRRFCQYLVGPGRGDERIEGVSPWEPAWYTFSAFTYAAIVAMVVIACVTTPLYQREYLRHVSNWDNWLLWSDFGFAVLFLFEAIVKTIADGFFFTPHAYFRSIWGLIDGVVLITLWTNVITMVFRNDSIARGIGAFKALRALRLLNISNSTRDTFHSVIIVGGYKVLSAAFVSLSLLVPFAILGINLFAGNMQECNDQGFAYPQLSNCVGEYNSTPFKWNVLAPHVVSNPQYNFDDFGSALFILFQIVSQEGWTGVLQSAMSITGRGLQPQQFASQGNAVYFIIFNLLGAVFVLTLFISVFMRNYTEQTGVAFLTTEQRSWLELRKLLKQITPTKRSVHDKTHKWRRWCYNLASKKRGKWARFVTVLLCFHLALLVLEYYPEPQWWNVVRLMIFFVLTLIFMANIAIKIIGLTWTRFRRSSWDVYSLFAVGGSFVTSLMTLVQSSNGIIEQLHKLFLVSVTLLLIPRNNQLDQLIKTTAASMPLIVNLLATWFVLFLVFAIAFTQAFGLTRFGSNENGNVNFRTVPKALILLFRTSIGEGWNSLMEDFATITPPFCVSDGSFFDSDCGSLAWARGLFVSWNIISMYIFVSLFVSAIFESFSYVYQRSSGLSIISRDEIRRFKQAWSEFDPNGTGYISKEKFPRLLGELSGVFQMRIYQGNFTVRNIIEDCVVQSGDPVSTYRRIESGIDLDKLAERVNQIPVESIRAQRETMNIFYHEMILSADVERGISFTSCLMILAHYNLITDSKCLRLEEFLRRRARLQRVQESIRRDTVRGFFDTVYWSRRFRDATRHRRDARLNGPPQIAIPEIYVQDEDESTATSGATEAHDFTSSPSPGSGRKQPPILPRILTSMQRDEAGRSIGSPSSEPLPGVSPTLSPTRASRLQSVDTEYHGAHRLSTQSPSLREEMLESFDNSAWGQSTRRSFTTKTQSNE